MPLYTYVVAYKDATYVSQARRSNFTGFGDWASGLPKTALSPSTRKELAGKMYGGFEAMPNRVGVWRKTINIAGSEMVVLAIHTAD
jgi:hypothetical protein